MIRLAAATVAVDFAYKTPCVTIELWSCTFDSLLTQAIVREHWTSWAPC